jgi:hypothetical protein
MSDNSYDREADNSPVIINQLIGQLQPLVERIAFLESRVQTPVRIYEDQNLRAQGQDAQILFFRERPLTAHMERSSSSDSKITDPDIFKGVRAELLPLYRLNSLHRPVPSPPTLLNFNG